MGQLESRVTTALVNRNYVQRSNPYAHSCRNEKGTTPPMAIPIQPADVNNLCYPRRCAVQWRKDIYAPILHRGANRGIGRMGLL